MIEFKLPSLGADMDEGKLLEWKIKPGAAVKKGDIVAVVDTTKAAVEVESWQEGTMQEQLVAVGETIPVGTVIATFLAPGETAPPPGAKRASRPPRRSSPPLRLPLRRPLEAPRLRRARLSRRPPARALASSPSTWRRSRARGRRAR